MEIHGVGLDWVVAEGPSIPRVTHIGGGMFKSIHAVDAIFMKWVLTTWTDDECKLIMENCYKALPAGGELIACEPVLPDDSNESQRTRALLEGDIFVMTIYRAKDLLNVFEVFIPQLHLYHKPFNLLNGEAAGVITQLYYSYSKSER
ncbi:caffeic acid 3-O-methyltransferase-like [Citrus clementina]|uniref:caffeic acid 3-O-methyltransferase-like n=1 Tax=Citrus clementina TaxID=85681 RepID=UPI000CED5C6A|nr:caffeic acid 3-O-methyltransferase-like [Citrus x clementina]